MSSAIKSCRFALSDLHVMPSWVSTSHTNACYRYIYSTHQTRLAAASSIATPVDARPPAAAKDASSAKGSVVGVSNDDDDEEDDHEEPVIHLPW